MERPEELVVIDASVVTKWFVEEEYSDRALDLRDDYLQRLLEIAAPQLLPFEVLNALRYNPEFGKRDLHDCAKALEGYQLWLYPILGELAERTIENALTYGITVYDASYITLAELKETKVYTADQELLQKARNLPWLLNISDYRRKSPKRRRL